MAKRKTLKDNSGNIVYPTTRADVTYMPDKTTTVATELGKKAEVTVTNTDPGEGSSLAAGHFIAVAGNSSPLVSTSDIANSAVTTEKMDWTTFGSKYVNATGEGWANLTNPASKILSTTASVSGKYLVLGSIYGETTGEAFIALSDSKGEFASAVDLRNGYHMIQCFYFRDLSANEPVYLLAGGNGRYHKAPGRTALFLVRIG